MSFDQSGSVRKTADGAVGVSGKPVRVYSVTIMNGATASSAVLRNGTTAAGDAYIYHLGTTNTSKTVSFDGGLLFPDGCFYDHTVTASAAIIEFATEI